MNVISKILLGLFAFPLLVGEQRSDSTDSPLVPSWNFPPPEWTHFLPLTTQCLPLRAIPREMEVQSRPETQVVSAASFLMPQELEEREESLRTERTNTFPDADPDIDLLNQPSCEPESEQLMSLIDKGNTEGIRSFFKIDGVVQKLNTQSWKFLSAMEAAALNPQMLGVLFAHLPLAAYSASQLLRSKIVHTFPKESLNLIFKQAPSLESIAKALKNGILDEAVEWIDYLLHEKLINPVYLFEQAITLAAEHGKEAIIRLFTQQYRRMPIIQKAFDLALEKGQAAVCRYLISKYPRLNLSTDRKSLAVLQEIGAIPERLSELKEFQSYPSDKKMEFIRHYLQKGNFGSQDLQILENNFLSFSGGDRKEILETLFVRYRSSPIVFDFILDCLALLSPSDRSDLVVTSILLDAEPFTLLLERRGGEEMPRERIDRARAQKELEKRKIADRIEVLKRGSSARMSQREFQAAVDLVPSHSDKILEAIRADVRAQISGVRFFNSDEHIFTLEKLPGVIIRSYSDPLEADRLLAQKEKTRALVEKENLDLIKIPRIQKIYVGGRPVLVEEMMDVIGHDQVQYKEELAIRNSDPVLRGKVNQALEQLSYLGAKYRYTDLKPMNAPLMNDGSGIALLDPEHGSSPDEGIYWFQGNKNIVSHIHDPNFEALRAGATRGDPQFFSHYYFTRSEADRRGEIALEREHQQWLAEKGGKDPWNVRGLDVEEARMAREIRYKLLQANHPSRAPLFDGNWLLSDQPIASVERVLEKLKASGAIFNYGFTYNQRRYFDRSSTAEYIVRIFY